jgi:hypothetical protein
VGNVLTCLEEGTGKFPSPVGNFHTIYIGDDRITLEWDAVKMAEKENAVMQYEVYYKELEDDSNAANIFGDNKVSEVT